MADIFTSRNLSNCKGYLNARILNAPCLSEKAEALKDGRFL